MRKIVVDMQNFLFADSIATAFRNSDYEIDVIRTESPKDTVELCQVYKPFVLIMEVTGYTPWNLCSHCRFQYGTTGSDRYSGCKEEWFY